MTETLFEPLPGVDYAIALAYNEQLVVGLSQSNELFSDAIVEKFDSRKLGQRWRIIPLSDNDNKHVFTIESLTNSVPISFPYEASGAPLRVLNKKQNITNEKWWLRVSNETYQIESQTALVWTLRGDIQATQVPSDLVLDQLQIYEKQSWNFLPLK